MNEQWALYDARGVPTGEVVARDQDAPILPEGRYHLVAVVWVYSQGSFLLEKRGKGKTYGPGQWTIPGGGVVLGETSAQGAVRELWEETGIRIRTGQLEYLNRTRRDDYLCDAWLLRVKTSADVTLADEACNEIDSLRWFDKEAVAELVANDYLGKHAESFFLACERVAK